MNTGSCHGYLIFVGLNLGSWEFLVFIAESSVELDLQDLLLRLRALGSQLRYY